MININIKKISISTVSGNSSGVFVGNNFLPNSDSFSKSNTNVSGNNVSDSVNILIDKDGIDFGVIDNDEACQVNVSNTGKNDASVTTTSTNNSTNSSGTSGSDPSSNSSSRGNKSSSNLLSSSSGSSSCSSSNRKSSNSSGSSGREGSSSDNSSNNGGSSTKSSKKSKDGYKKEITVNYHSLFSGPNS